MALGNQSPTRQSLTVCVIGRNEAANIARCRDSLKSLESELPRFECIFVDSASTDQSATIASRHFDRVLVLNYSPHLNASAGRYVGTTHADGDWILYLDADMTFQAEFVSAVARAIQGQVAEAGLMGDCSHVYEGGERTYLPLSGAIHGEQVAVFGGAVLLRKSAVLKVGNWNPRLYSNEEAELYSRLRAQRYSVAYYAAPMVHHHAKAVSTLVMGIGSFIPYKSVLGKKYYGAGQSVRSAYISSSLWQLVRIRSGPALYLLGLAAAALFSASGNYAAGASIGVGALTWAIWRGGWKAPLTFATFVPQIALGIFRYPSDYQPTVAFDSVDMSTRKFTQI